MMLRRVTLTSFGNTNFDATTPLSVTIIMTQCGKLTLENGIQYNKEPLSKAGRECRNELINRRSYEENANMVFFHVWLLAADG
jgi:hypothetical protein